MGGASLTALAQVVSVKDDYDDAELCFAGKGLKMDDAKDAEVIVKKIKN